MFIKYMHLHGFDDILELEVITATDQVRNSGEFTLHSFEAIGTT